MVKGIFYLLFLLFLFSGFGQSANGISNENPNKHSPENATISPIRSLFSSHVLEFRGQMYEIGGYAYQIEYKYAWFDYLSTDLYLRKFPHASYELGTGVTLYFPIIRLIYAQATLSRPFQNSYPEDEALPTGIAFAFEPDFSYSFRGGLFLPLGEPARLPLFITLSAGKSWYVDTNFRRVYWLTPYDEFTWPGEYEVRKERVTREYMFFEIGIGIYF